MDSQWLQLQFRLNPDKTKADLARALGLEPPAISKILAGNRQIKAQEYVKMREFFGMGGTSYNVPITDDYSIHGCDLALTEFSDQDAATDQVDKKGAARAGSNQKMAQIRRDASGQGRFSTKNIPYGALQEGRALDGDWVMRQSGAAYSKLPPFQLEEPLPDKIKIFPIREKVMEPDLKLGDHVIVDLRDKNPAHPGLFVISDGFGYMARHCVLKKQIGQASVISISARCGNFEVQHIGVDEVIVMGRVIGKIIGI